MKHRSNSDSNNKGLIDLGYDLNELAIDFFILSNNGFFGKYGFNWIPVEPYYSNAKTELEMQAQQELEFEMGGFL